MNEKTVLASTGIPVRTDAAKRFDERQTAIARWCKATRPEIKTKNTLPPTPEDSHGTVPPA